MGEENIKFVTTGVRRRTKKDSDGQWLSLKRGGKGVFS